MVGECRGGVPGPTLLALVPRIVLLSLRVRVVQGGGPPLDRDRWLMLPDDSCRMGMCGCGTESWRTGRGRLVERDLGCTVGVRLFDLDRRRVVVATVGVRLLERARLEERVREVVLVLVRLEERPRPFGAGEGWRCWLTDRRRAGEGWLVLARLEDLPRLEPLRFVEDVGVVPGGTGVDRRVERERLRWLLWLRSGMTSTPGEARMTSVLFLPRLRIECRSEEEEESEDTGLVVVVVEDPLLVKTRW